MAKKGGTISEEQKRKISESLKGRKRPDMVGDNNPAKRPEVRKKISEYHKGVSVPEERKKRISETLKKRYKNHKHPLEGYKHTDEAKKKIADSRFKGTDEKYWHHKAFALFGKSKCELCGMTLEEHREKWGSRFDMHYTLEPKDYKCMEPEAWETYCKVCHGKIDSHPENFGVV